MSSAAQIVPAETDLLCQRCGYILSGLGDSPACPECGKPVIESIRPDLRQPAIWEIDPKHRPKWIRLLITSAQIIFRPKRFYKSFVTRSPSPAAQTFAWIQRAIAAAVLAVGIVAHEAWSEGLLMQSLSRYRLDVAIGWVAAFSAILLGMALTTLLAGRLTAWEAKMRGYRLPMRAVGRGLNYHTAHLQPVAMLISATMIANYVLSSYGLLDSQAGPMYLYLLCGEVIVAAVYLFLTYWTAMRSMLYANQ